MPVFVMTLNRFLYDCFCNTATDKYRRIGVFTSKKAEKKGVINIDRSRIAVTHEEAMCHMNVTAFEQEQGAIYTSWKFNSLEAHFITIKFKYMKINDCNVRLF